MPSEAQNSPRQPSLYIHTLQPPPAAASTAKITHHEARTSLLGGQPLSRNYPPYANTTYQIPPNLDTQPGGYHHREGFPTTLPPPVRRPPRMYMPNTRWTWAFMLTAIAQVCIALALESYACPPLRARARHRRRRPKSPRACR